MKKTKYGKTKYKKTKYDATNEIFHKITFLLIQETTLLSKVEFIR